MPFEEALERAQAYYASCVKGQGLLDGYLHANACEKDHPDQRL